MLEWVFSTRCARTDSNEYVNTLVLWKLSFMKSKSLYKFTSMIETQSNFFGPTRVHSEHPLSIWNKLLVEISLENNLKVISLGSDRKINIGHIQTGIQIAFYWSWRPQMWTCQTKLGLNKFIPWKPLFSVWCERLCSVGIWNVFVCREKNASRNLTS